MVAQPQHYIMVADYLAHERHSAGKSEYFAGTVFAMAGGSEAHNVIVSNVVAALHGQLRRRQCTVYPSDMRLRIPATGLYTYPDVSVVCGAAQFDDDHRDTLLNPTVIIEVLSPSTESYDRGKKFQNYRTLPSLQEYLLVAQDGYHIEHYVRQPNNQWLLAEANDPTTTLHLSALGCDLTLADVYEKVGLDGPAL